MRKRKSEDPCSICLEELKDGITLGCGHKFHQSCVEELQKFTNNVCPLCRYIFVRTVAMTPSIGRCSHMDLKYFFNG